MKRAIMFVLLVCLGFAYAQEDPSLPTPFSVQMHSLGAPTEWHQKAIDAVVELGVKQVRDELFWHEVEKEKGTLSIPQRYLDNINYSVKNGVDTLIILDYANMLYDEGEAPRSDEARKAFARYAEHLARELKGKVRYFEVWNEPNVDAFWRPKKNPENYTKLLKEVYPAVKRGNPEATVVAVSVSSVDREFLNTVIEHGGLDYMDVLSLHPYCHPRSPEEAGIFNQVREVIEQMKSLGKPKPVWLTEIGYPTNTGGGVTEIRQAELLTRVYLLAETVPEIQTTFWYWLGPDGEKEWWAEDRFGVLHQDRSPKPSYIAWKNMIEQLEGSTFRNAYQLTEKSHVLEFTKDDRLFYALWAEDTVVPVVIPDIEDAVEVVFLDGSSQTLTPLNKKAYLELSSMPFFVVSKNKVEFESSAPPIELVFPAQDELPRGRKVSVNARLSDSSFKDSRLAIRPFPLYEQSAVSQVSAREIYINPQTDTGDIAMLTRVFDITESLPFALLVNKCKVGEPVALRIVPLPPEKDRKEILLEARNLTEATIMGDLVVTEKDKELVRTTISNLKSGDTFTLKIGLPGAGSPDDLYTFEAVMTLFDGIKIHYTSPVTAFYQCLYAEKPPTIDGDLSDWNRNVQTLRINRKENVIDGFTEWGGTEDCNSRIYTCWDDAYFYIACEMEDDAISMPYTGFQIYNNDGIEVYFDTDHDSDMEDIRYNADDHQYGVSMSEGKDFVWGWSQLGGPSVNSKSKIDLAPTKEKTISGKEFKGFIIEAAIPLKELNLEPYDGKHIGFDIAQNDDDDPKSMNPFKQELQMSWTGIPNAYQNPTAFGDLFFEKPGDKKKRIEDGVLYLDGEPFQPFGFWVFGFSARGLHEISRHPGINAVAAEVPWVRLEPSEGIFDYEYLERVRAFLRTAKKYNLKVLLQMGAHYYPHWLERDHPSLRFRTADGSPGEANFCRFCFDNEEFRQYLFRFANFLVDSVKDEDALIGYCLWNEPALNDEVCYCTATLTAFHTFLKKEYSSSIQDLNDVWETAYLKFEEVEPPTHEHSHAHRGAAWNDWTAFRQVQLRDFFGDYARAVKSVDPDTPLTVKSVWMPLDSRYAAFSATRYDHFLDTVDILGNDPYPHPMDFFINRWIADALCSAVNLHDSNNDAPVWWLEYNHAFWKEYGQLTPGEARAWTYQSLAHGISGFFYFFYPLQRFDPGAGDNGLALVYADDHSPLPATHEIYHMAEEMQDVAPLLRRFKPQKPEIALFQSLDTFAQQAHEAHPTAQFSAAADILYRLQLPFDIINEEHIRRGALSNYRLLIAAGVDNCDDDIVDAIGDFNAHGGWIIATAGFARLTGRGEVRQYYPPEFLGVHVDAYMNHERIDVVTEVIPYVSEYNNRQSVEKTTEAKRASRSVIEFITDFGKVTQGDKVMAGTVAGFPDTSMADETVEKLAAMPPTKDIAVFEDGSTAITLKERCVYIATDLLWVDQPMLDFFDEISNRAGVVRRAYAVYADQPDIYVPHIDVRCWENGAERLIFLVNAPETKEYRGNPVNATVFIKYPGEAYNLNGVKEDATYEKNYSRLNVTLSPAENKIYRVK